MTWVVDPFEDETAALAGLVDFGGKRVLEIGAGDGRLTWRYGPSAASVLAIDPDEERVAKAQADMPAELAGHVRFQTADVVELDVPRNSFDLAYFSWSL